MKKDELKARAIEILNTRSKFVGICEKHFGAEDPLTRSELKKWFAMVDAFAELFEMSTSDFINECEWTE